MCQFLALFTTLSVGCNRGAGVILGAGGCASTSVKLRVQSSSDHELTLVRVPQHCTFVAVELLMQSGTCVSAHTDIVFQQVE